MLEINSILQAWLVGLGSGFLLSIPVGPINVTIINEGARRGFRWALLIGLGAVLMETIYCVIAFAGFSAFLTTKLAKAAMQVFSFLFLGFIGFKYLFAPSIPEHIRTVDRVEEKLNPHSAFATGFVRVLGNPGVLLLWITLAAAFLAHEWVADDYRHKFGCVAGVAAGATIWFLGLSYAISLGHRRFSHKTLLRMEHISGACLLVAAAWIGAKIIFQLARVVTLR